MSVGSADATVGARRGLAATALSRQVAPRTPTTLETRHYTAVTGRSARCRSRRRSSPDSRTSSRTSRSGCSTHHSSTPASNSQVDVTLSSHYTASRLAVKGLTPESEWALVDLEVKRLKVKVTQLSMRCRRRGCACRYDCLNFPVVYVQRTEVPTRISRSISGCSGVGKADFQVAQVTRKKCKMDDIFVKHCVNRGIAVSTMNV